MADPVALKANTPASPLTDCPHAAPRLCPARLGFTPPYEISTAV